MSGVRWATRPAPLERDAIFAALAGAVYADWSEAARATAELGVPLVEYASHRDVDCMLAMPDGGAFAVLVFRGTEFTSLHLRDISNNLGRPRAWAGPGLVHSGYAAQLERIRDRAQAMFEKVPDSVPLFVTGHSLGGALGGLFALWAIAVRGGRLAGVTTFGAPKAATAAAWVPLRRAASFAGGLEVMVYRIAGDFAPYWPPSLFLTQPCRALVLDSPDRWIGPLRRHDVARYRAALRSRLAARRQAEAGPA